VAALEKKLATEVGNLVDRALQVDPAARYLDALEMASEFEALGTRWRELARRVETAGASGPTGQVSSVPAVAPPSPRVRAAALVQEVEVAEEVLTRRPARSWAGAALAVLFLLQAVQLVIGASALWLSWHAWQAVAPGDAAAAAWALFGGSGSNAAPPAAESPPAPSRAGPPAQPPPELLAQAIELEPAPVVPEPAAVEETVLAPPQQGHSRTEVRREVAREAISPVAEKQKSPPPPEPAATPPAEAPAAAATGDAVLLVVGAQSYLVGDQGRLPPGSVPPGSYQVWVEAGGNFVQAGVFSVAAGERITVRCGFGTCRATR
jgi:hypothetical protein